MRSDSDMRPECIRPCRNPGKDFRHVAWHQDVGRRYVVRSRRAEARRRVSEERLIRVAVVGSGFWAPFQVAGWGELPGVEIVAVYNRTKEKAEALARRTDIDASYDDADVMLRRERVDVV